LLAASVEKNRDRLMAHHFAARRALFARAMAVSDYRTALSALRDEAELLALYPPKGMAVTGKGGGTILLHIVEEITHRTPPPGLPGIVEEVVYVSPDGGPAPAAEGETPPRTEGLPAQ
jgi:hypothetical protein